jgi:two-component system cell cycle response regulator
VGARILVVEDNRANLDLMLYLLGAFAHEADGFADPLGALAAAERRPYDLALADILMPGIDGYEFARRFKANAKLRDVPLIAVTALAMVGDRERIVAAGFDGYIPKPIDPEQFAPLVGRLLSAGRKTEEDVTGPVVLLVDDIAVNRDVIRETLRPFGYRVIEAEDADEGYAKALESNPALVLSDLHMPGGGGLALLQNLKAHPALCSIPVMFLSATAWLTSEKLCGLELGAAKFLLRPIDPMHLIREVRTLIGEARHV